MRRLLICATAILIAGATLGADVKTEQKTQFKFEGMLGRVVGLFGGKAAKEGVTSTVWVKGDRKMMVTDNTAQLIDLAEQKIYDINLKDKSYKVITFDEMRRRMQEAQDRARKSEGKPEKDTGGKEYEIDVDVKETGQQKAISGYTCKQTILTMTVHEKGKTIEQAGGMVLTADSWLAPTIAAMKEVTDFDMRYAKALFGVDPAASAEQMAAAMAMYPGMKELMTKFQGQKGAFEGTPLDTTVTVQSVKTPEQIKAEEQKGSDDNAGSGMSGMLGGLGRRVMRKKDDSAAGADKSRATVMTSTTQVLSIATSVSGSDVAIPAGFKQK